ncbi:MAG: hypothetical protein ABI995_14190, partial [Acidobacteriota bacterium]
MKKASGAVLSASLLLLCATAHAQPGVQDCRNEVADALGLNQNQVNASQGASYGNGPLMVDWQANLSGRLISGFCEVQPNGRLMSVQLGRIRGG